MQESSYEERLTTARLKKRLKGAPSNLSYELAIARLARTYKINLTNLSFTLGVPGPIARSLSLRTRIVPEATLNTTRSEDKYIRH